MTQEHDTAYRRLPATPSAAELEEIFTPTPADMTLIRSITDQPHRRFTATLQLKTAQYLGRFMPIGPTPERIVHHIAETLGFPRTFKLDDLDAYDRSRTRDRHVVAAGHHGRKGARKGGARSDSLSQPARSPLHRRQFSAPSPAGSPWRR